MKKSSPGSPYAQRRFPGWLPAILSVLLAGLAPDGRADNGMPAFKPGDHILFQGDSITDGNRGRSDDPNHILGHGYVFIIAAKYGAAYPERHLTFINRGISGNKVGDLAGRWQGDTLNLKSEILSILIGINDLGDNNTPTANYEQTYDKLLADTLAALPHVRFVLGEPFALPVGKYKENFVPRQAAVRRLAQTVEKLAAKYHAPVVHYQRAFDEACKRAPADYWIWDGIHPTYSGQQIMADEWERTVSTFYGSTFSQ